MSRVPHIPSLFLESEAVFRNEMERAGGSKCKVVRLTVGGDTVLLTS